MLEARPQSIPDHVRRKFAVQGIDKLRENHAKKVAKEGGGYEAINLAELIAKKPVQSETTEQEKVKVTQNKIDESKVQETRQAIEKNDSQIENMQKNLDQIDNKIARLVNEINNTNLNLKVNQHGHIFDTGAKGFFKKFTLKRDRKKAGLDEKLLRLERLVRDNDIYKTALLQKGVDTKYRINNRQSVADIQPAKSPPDQSGIVIKGLSKEEVAGEKTHVNVSAYGDTHVHQRTGSGEFVAPVKEADMGSLKNNLDRILQEQKNLDPKNNPADLRKLYTLLELIDINSLAVATENNKFDNEMAAVAFLIGLARAGQTATGELSNHEMDLIDRIEEIAKKPILARAKRDFYDAEVKSALQPELTPPPVFGIENQIDNRTKNIRVGASAEESEQKSEMQMKILKLKEIDPNAPDSLELALQTISTTDMEQKLGSLSGEEASELRHALLRILKPVRKRFEEHERLMDPITKAEMEEKIELLDSITSRSLSGLENKTDNNIIKDAQFYNRQRSNRSEDASAEYRIEKLELKSELGKELQQLILKLKGLNLTNLDNKVVAEYNLNKAADSLQDLNVDQIRGAINKGSAEAINMLLNLEPFLSDLSNSEYYLKKIKTNNDLGEIESHLLNEAQLIRLNELKDLISYAVRRLNGGSAEEDPAEHFGEDIKNIAILAERGGVNGILQAAKDLKKLSQTELRKTLLGTDKERQLDIKDLRAAVIKITDSINRPGFEKLSSDPALVNTVLKLREKLGSWFTEELDGISHRLNQTAAAPENVDSVEKNAA